MRPTQPLTAEECAILGVLLDPALELPERTVGWLARYVDMTPTLLEARLRSLESRSPPLARRVEDESWEVVAWVATDAGREAYAAGCA